MATLDAWLGHDGLSLLAEYQLLAPAGPHCFLAKIAFNAAYGRLQDVSTRRRISV